MIESIMYLVFMIVIIGCLGMKERKEFDEQSNVIVGTITKIERTGLFEILLYIKTENGEEIKIIEKGIGRRNINHPSVGSKIKVIKLEDNRYISDYVIRCRDNTKGSMYLAVIMGVIAIIVILCMRYRIKIYK